MALSRRTWLTFIFLIAVLALYAYGVISASHIPVEVDAVALPLDFMVGIPLAFYLVVVRPRKLSTLCVIPVIWVGCGLSAIALDSPNAGALPLLLAALIPVELAIAAKEVAHMVRVFKDAKAKSSDPMQWFYETAQYLVRKEIPARMMAAELSVWYYALFSWRKKPTAKPGEATFSYHNAGGYMNMMLGLALAFPVEIMGVHLLLSQWSGVAAIIVTALSAYAAVWLLGDARARMMRPIVVGEDAVRLECGIQMEAVVSLDEIESIGSKAPTGLDESDILNYGTFYQANTWIVTKSRVEVRTLLGARSVRAIGLSVDNPVAFVRDWQTAR